MDAMIFVFWMLSFKPAFSLSSFIFIKRLLSFSSLSAIRVVSPTYLTLLIFLLEIFIPACASSSPAFFMMYSACKLNKQGDNMQPWHTPFPSLSQSVVPCPVLTVASYCAYRFLRRPVRWSGIPISLRLFQFIELTVQWLVKTYLIGNKWCSQIKFGGRYDNYILKSLCIFGDIRTFLLEQLISVHKY